jgi:hypothetical protein
LTHTCFLAGPYLTRPSPAPYGISPLHGHLYNRSYFPLLSESANEVFPQRLCADVGRTSPQQKPAEGRSRPDRLVVGFWGAGQRCGRVPQRAQAARRRPVATGTGPSSGTAQPRRAKYVCRDSLLPPVSMACSTRGVISVSIHGGGGVVQLRQFCHTLGLCDSLAMTAWVVGRLLARRKRFGRPSGPGRSSSYPVIILSTQCRTCSPVDCTPPVGLSGPFSGDLDAHQSPDNGANHSQHWNCSIVSAAGILGAIPTSHGR